ncbi:MAG: hypothetical protein KDA30_14795, partial [Phycisphaerales bacterium]|nr:hypothetical protein [Phycisphaerales bacterium]
MTHTKTNTSDSARRDAFLAICMPAAREAASCYTVRFNLRADGEDVSAETCARVVSLIASGREPFDGDAGDASVRDRAVRFVWGIAANVGREYIRKQRKRSAVAHFDERAAVCEQLELSDAPSEKRLEFNETILAALAALKNDVTADVRETLIVEEIRRNEYGRSESARLCEGSGLSYERISAMVEQQKGGKWSPEAWRQRVKRARDKAREALSVRSAELGLVSLVLGAIVSLGAAMLPNVNVNDSTQNPRLDAGAEVRLVDSTQNGNPKGGKDRFEDQLASTQNGNPKG